MYTHLPKTYAKFKFAGGFPVVPALLTPQRDQHELRQSHLQENDRRPVHAGEEPVPTGEGVPHVRRRRGKLQRYHLITSSLVLPPTIHT